MDDGFVVEEGTVGTCGCLNPRFKPMFIQYVHLLVAFRYNQYRYASVAVGYK